MPAQSRNYIARADINSSVFVKRDGTDHGIQQCVADEEAVGISHEGTREAPITGITPLAAKNGESCQVYTLGWPCEVIAAAAVVAGDKLKPDANGQAVVAAAGERYSAIADAAAAAGERAKVTVQSGVA